MEIYMSLSLIKHAKEIEEKAMDSYTHNVGILRLRGMDAEDVKEVVMRVSIETAIHKEIMSGMLKAYEETLERVLASLRGIEEIVPSKHERAVIVKILKEHLAIESDMVETYRKLAQELRYPILKAIAEILAKNEEEHHRMISDLIKKYEES
ncbi:MAG: ferritin family protein [Sulfolobales archaeon]|nr:hypothetical protein [Sulfolobales archaeon]MCX8209238.1 hypothetical protein [Sulfolobales archaeon]MDW8010507.1 ferritin family protein [Sulfolobales archaeon]